MINTKLNSYRMLGERLVNLGQRLQDGVKDKNSDEILRCFELLESEEEYWKWQTLHYCELCGDICDTHENICNDCLEKGAFWCTNCRKVYTAEHKRVLDSGNNVCDECEMRIKEYRKNKKKSLGRESFNYAFCLDRKHVFEVRYNRTGNNDHKDFATCACVFNQPKTDWNGCGQAQERLLPGFDVAWNFYKKWDKRHLNVLTDEEYAEVRKDIEALKEAYPYYLERFDDGNISFWDIKEKSMEIKRTRQQAA